jgi:hypothetical protein
MEQPQTFPYAFVLACQASREEQMARALPRPPAIQWRHVALLCAVIPSVAWSSGLIVAIIHTGEPFDWWTLRQAAERVGTDALYQWSSAEGYDYAYRYSPLLAWLMGPIAALGLEVWRLLHLAALAVLPWRIAAIALLAWPFWEDVWSGNVMTFAAVSGSLALRGNRWGAGGFLVLALLVPRPLMLPMIAWIWWRHPRWRLAGVAIVAIVGAATLASGQAGEWVASASQGADAIGYSMNLSPSRFFGPGWLVVGVPLGAWLTLRGHLGFAALAVSPYVLPYYLLTLLWEVRPGELAAATAATSPDSP